MLVRAAEDSFERGLTAFHERRWCEALAFFEAAVSLEQRQRVASPQARYLSFYGLCLGKTRNKTHEAVRWCREATRLEQYNPDLYDNLVETLVAAGHRREAHRAALAGLRQEPAHEGLRRQLRRLGRRQRPPIPFLSRSHPINVLIGKRRHAARSERGRRRVG